jgi:quinol monooxygenase YgiN
MIQVLFHHRPFLLENPMLIRIWQLKVKPDRFDELEDFTRTYFLSMFKEQKGCLGVLFTHDENYCAMISIWEDMQAIEKLRDSASYNDAIEKILGSGMLEDEQSVELFETFGGFLDIEDVAKLL